MVTNHITLTRLRFADNSNTGTTFGGGWKALLSMEEIASVTATDICFVDNFSPSGSMIEIRGDGSTIVGFYSNGGASLEDVTIEEECVGGAILQGLCVEPDAVQCPMDTIRETTAPTEEDVLVGDGIADVNMSMTMIPSETEASSDETMATSVGGDEASAPSTSATIAGMAGFAILVSLLPLGY